MDNEEDIQRPKERMVYEKPAIVELELELEGSFLNSCTSYFYDRVAVDDEDFAEDDFD